MTCSYLGKMQMGVILVLSFIFVFSNVAYAQLKLEAIPTFENMSIEFKAPSGVGSENNAAKLKYKMAGGTWLEALDLYYNKDNGLYAGSVVNLRPDTQYEFAVTLNSGETGTVTQRTWSEKFSVGETIYLPKVTTKTYEIKESGAPGAYRLYTFDPAVGAATLDGQGSQDYNIKIAPGVHHIIIDGLLLKNVIQNNILIGENCRDIVIQNNELTKWGRNPFQNTNAEGAIADENVKSTKLERIIIQGNYIHTPNYPSFTWEHAHPQGPSGVMFRNTKGNHVIRYNTIMGTEKDRLAYGLRGADNYSFDGGFGHNSDIYGNFVQYSWGSGLEVEGGNKNNRIYKNYIDEVFFPISMAVNSVGPSYVFQNISGVTRRDSQIKNSDDYKGKNFLKTGGNNTYEVKRIYVFNNLTLQPPSPDGGKKNIGTQSGWDDAGAETGNGMPKEMVIWNNIFIRNDGSSKGDIGVLKPGNECTNDIDYNMFLGSIGKNCASSPFQKNGINLSDGEGPRFDSGNGSHQGLYFDTKSMTGKFYLAAGAPGQGDGTAIPNFLEGNSIDMGPHQRGEAVMKFGHKAFNGNNNQPPVNTAPLISELSDKVIQQDDLLKDVAFTIDDKETDANSLVVSATSSNQNVVKATDIKLGGNGNERIFSVKPVLNATGVSTITISVSDGKLVANSSFILTVQEKSDKPGNSAPVLTKVEDKVYNKGASVSIAIKAEDADGDKLTYAATGLPGSLTINTTSGLISGVATVKGSYNVKVTAKDPKGLSDEVQFNLTVNETQTHADAYLLINAGGGAVTYKDEVWETDQHAKGGSTYSNVVAIKGTENDKIYQSERNGTYSYQIPLPKGKYDVKLHFAEIFHGIKNKNGVGARVFDVNIENGQGVLKNYDIMKKAGGPAIAVIETLKDVEVLDGNLTIALKSIKNHAKVSAIEIIAIGGKINNPPTIAAVGDKTFTEGNSVSLQIDAEDPDQGDVLAYTATGLPASLSIGANTGLIQGKVTKAGSYVVKVKAADQDGLFAEVQFSLTVKAAPVAVKSMYNFNAGGASVTYNNQTWKADQYAKGGQVNTSAISIKGTENDKIYQSERYGNFSYEIPLPKGSYDVKLHFAEVFHGIKNKNGVGARVFNVNIEDGQGSLLNYDIMRAAGGAAIAVVENIKGVYVTDGHLSLDFKTIRNHAKVSAIEIIPLDDIMGSPLESPAEISSKLNVYPNPFDEVFVVDFGMTQSSAVKLLIFDSFGKKVYQEHIHAEDSTQPYQVDVSHLSLKSNEVYYIRTVDDNSVKKFARVIKK